MVLDAGLWWQREGKGVPAAQVRFGRRAEWRERRGAGGLTCSSAGVLAALFAVLVVACGSGGSESGGSERAPTVVESASSVAGSAESAPTDQPTPSDPAVTVPGLTGILEQYREDEILNLMQVKATNRSRSSVDILDLRLDWPGITGNKPLARRVLLPPGQRFDIPINAGRAVCSDPPGADEQPPPGRVLALGRLRSTAVRR